MRLSLNVLLECSSLNTQVSWNMNINYSSRRKTPIGIVSTLACMLLAVSFSGTAVARPDNWAIPLAIDTGVPNLNRVTENIYRSAQPTKEGFVFLSKLPVLKTGDKPVKTIISLRAFNDDAPVVPVNSPLHLEQIRFKTWHPEDEDVIKFLRIATTPSMQPVLVHCQHGSDRTGTMVAIYRIAYQGWTKAQATDEMIHGGYGFHPMWQNLLRYIEKLDISKIKEQVSMQGDWK